MFRSVVRSAARPVVYGVQRGFSSGNRAAASKSSLIGASAFVLGVSAYTISEYQVSCGPCCKVWQNVRKDIEDSIDAHDEKINDGTSIAGTLVRLAWHASGTYSIKDNTGGSNGAHMRFAPEANWGCNAGLGSARDFLEPIKKKYPDVSYADLWTFSGVVAIEKMGGPKIKWRCGRTDSSTPTTVPDGRLPNADNGGAAKDCTHIREIFNRMGFSDREIVALMGAHAVGRCHTDASGYWGPWTFAETAFSNEYFRLLLDEKWTLKKTHNGKKWTGPQQYEDKTGAIMMLPADLALVSDPAFKTYVELYSKDQDAFFADFSSAFGKLLELGVTFPECHKKSAKTGLFGLGFWGL